MAIKSIHNLKPEVMKKHIIIIVMLVFALGLNAQTTDRNTRTAPAGGTTKSAAEERKSNPAEAETRTREAAPARTVAPAENRQETPARTVAPAENRQAAPARTVAPAENRQTAPARTVAPAENRQETPARTAPTERKTEPVYNESRNRETPPARTTTTTRTVETTKTVAPGNRSVDQERPRTVNDGNQNPPRKAGTATTPARENDNRNSTGVRPQGGDRSVGNARETDVNRNREYVPRNEQVYVEKRQAYRTPERPRTVRTVNTSTNYVHHPVEYRKTYYPYAEPRRLEIIWDINMYNEYRYMYPQYDYWYYPYGYRIHTISAYDADRYVGEIARIFGKVSDVWYERNTDEYFLFFGAPYPYHDFSVIISGKNARRYSHRPDRYFINRNIAVTGLVSIWDNRPEVLVRKRSQIEVYF